MQRANVYIDGFNLFYGALKGRPALKWLDLAAFGRALLLPDHELHRVRYFTARVGGRAVDPEEKGSDVNLATHLLLDAFREDAKVAVVVSDDYDLKEPLRVVVTALGRTLGVASPRRSPRLGRAVEASFYRPVHEATLRECQLPATVETDGGAISRPADWSV